MNEDTQLLLVLLIVTVIAFAVFVFRSQANKERLAEALFERWRNALLALEKERLREEIKLDLETWKADEELKIRADALNRSDHTHFGKMTEHLVPWLADTKFDPRDMRFIGGPVDFVVFDGLSAGNDVTIYFVEVKSGRNCRLTLREERVRQAALARRVSYRMLKISRAPGASA
jgi:predicted Holliday junction resolvase-like endonuclease